jgi:GDP-mannose 6-dehydrogenase
MKISVLGLGYVGAVSLACLARDRHQVIGVDIDSAKLALLSEGKTPVVEAGMVELMAEVMASGRVTVTAEVQAAVHGSDISLICVGTPSAQNGSQDQSAVVRVTRELGAALRSKTAPHIIVFRSTLAPGTVDGMLRPLLEETSGKRHGEDFYVCFQPEFLREGSSIRDYDRPPFTVVGTAHEYPVTVLKALFGHLPCEFHVTSIQAAEMVKYCCNNFHALKITFANETARLCEALGVDSFEVMDLLCRDTQLNISSAYLRPGFAFGGSCLPKDLRATMYLSKQHDVDLPMLGSILASNRQHLEHAIAKVLASGRRRIGMIGLSFKTGTDDLRESPLVLLAEHLIGKGLSLSIYDPGVTLSRLLGANRRYIEQTIAHIGSLMRERLEEVVEESDLLIVAQGDPATASALVQLARKDQLLLDLTRLPNRADIKCKYEGLCW